MVLNAVFAGFFFLFSCQPGDSRSNEGKNLSEERNNEGKNDLYEEVMAIHDAIMPTMSDLISLNRELKRKLEKETNDILL